MDKTALTEAIRQTICDITIKYNLESRDKQRYINDLTDALVDKVLSELGITS
jgi:hypothetical protein